LLLELGSTLRTDSPLPFPRAARPRRARKPGVLPTPRPTEQPTDSERGRRHDGGHAVTGLSGIYAISSLLKTKLIKRQHPTRVRTGNYE